MLIRKVLYLFLCMGLMLTIAQSADKKDKPKSNEAVAGTSPAPYVQLITKMDSLSYAIGASIGTNLKHDSLMLDVAKMSAGLQDMLYGDKPLLNQQELQAILMNFQTEMRQKAMQQKLVQGEAAKKRGDDFLADNKKKEGVKVTASGLQYKVIKSGTGTKSPSASNTVKVAYKGTLIDGTEFDKNDSIEFSVGGVIKGWTEALQLMKEGDKWMLYIPGELAYGERGAGEKIGPFETLVFEVELIKIKDDADKDSHPAVMPAKPGKK